LVYAFPRRVQFFSFLAGLSARRFAGEVPIRGRGGAGVEAENLVLYNLTLNFAEDTMKKACCGVVAWVALLSVFVATTRAAPPFLPDPHLTPGDVLTTDPPVICVPGYTATVRNVP
jgi:hypothetical protein